MPGACTATPSRSSRTPCAPCYSTRRVIVSSLAFAWLHEQGVRSQPGMRRRPDREPQLREAHRPPAHHAAQKGALCAPVGAPGGFQ